MSSFFLIETREGTLSLGYRENGCEVSLHSTYAPSREAVQFIDSRKDKISEAKVILVYGLGMGYHLKELQKHLAPDTKVYVLEMNPEVVQYTDHVFLISEYRKKGFVFFISDVLMEVQSFFSKVISECDMEDFFLLIHKPSLKVIPKNCNPIRHMLEDWELKRETFERYGKIMEINFEENILKMSDYFCLESFKNSYKEKPIIIVSAGPSLNLNKHFLPELKNKALVIAVGSVVKPLIDMGFIPDCMIITDPHPVTCRQVEGLDLKIPLFFFPTIQPKIVQNYKGPKVILFQKGFEKSEILALKNDCSIIETGGSVATTALELSIFLGGNPIIFVGQDLAFTNGKSHAEGATSHKFVPNLNNRRVKGVNGNLIPTSKAFSIYLKWIENKIRQNLYIQFIDATEGGAYIEGTELFSLEEITNKLDTEIPVDSLLDKLLNKETEA
ncbi:MAG: motility associated factor glycosyltransferase family protein [Halanaerobiales bacterium]|nr:motility associated factor glycosyltransferase family protein [Halanaerobiales bacterium]